MILINIGPYKLVLPDEESEQWVKAIAQPHQWPYVIATKARFGDNALTRLKDMGVKNIWSSDSLLHSTNAFSIIDTVTRQLKK
ncbi:MAG: hypothetical protein ACJA2G_001695 [Cognaticolwellia sp.]